MRNGGVVNLESEQARMHVNMVTKSYLDDKLANLHSDIIQYTRREIEKALN